MPSERSSPPIRNAGSRPQASSTWATIPQVVVLPCVPATAIARLSDATWPSSVAAVDHVARRRPGRPPARGCPRGWRWRPPPRRPRAGWRRRGRWPARCRRAQARRVGRLRAVGARDRGAERAQTSARPLMPAPPMPTKCRLRSDMGGGGIRCRLRSRAAQLRRPGVFAIICSVAPRSSADCRRSCLLALPGAAQAVTTRRRAPRKGGDASARPTPTQPPSMSGSPTARADAYGQPGHVEPAARIRRPRVTT